MNIYAESYAPVNPKSEAIAMVTTTTIGASASIAIEMIMSLLPLYTGLRNFQAARYADIDKTITMLQLEH